MSDQWLTQTSVEVPAGKRVEGDLRPPSSKSVSHRLLNLTMLSGRPHRISNLLDALDLQLFQDAFRTCGWGVSGDAADLALTPPQQPVAGVPRIVCGNAGTMFRFMVATRCVMPGVSIVDGTERLRERPVGALVDALQQLGARIEFLGEPGCAPLKITGASLEPGLTHLDASESSQYLSALLMACSCLDGPSRIEVSSLVSTPYVDVTLAALDRFGWPVPKHEGSDPALPGGRWSVEGRAAGRSVAIEPRRLEVEADYSAAAYPAAAAMISGGTVEIRGLDPASPQGDRKFLDVLVRAGGHLEWVESSSGEGDERSVPTVRFGGRPGDAIDVDLGDMPDQVPTMAAVAAFCRGTTRIRNVAHLRIKESDRLRAVALEWSKLGINVRETPDGLEIDGRPEWLDQLPVAERCEVATYDDHRIAMSAALVGLRRAVTVLEPSVVAKSYPQFWSDFFRLLSD